MQFKVIHGHAVNQTFFFLLCMVIFEYFPQNQADWGLNSGKPTLYTIKKNALHQFTPRLCLFVSNYGSPTNIYESVT